METKAFINRGGNTPNQNLDQYHVPEGADIKFDEYGRPYEQTKHGRMMLSRKQPYPYSIKN